MTVFWVIYGVLSSVQLITFVCCNEKEIYQKKKKTLCPLFSISFKVAAKFTPVSLRGYILNEWFILVSIMSQSLCLFCFYIKMSSLWCSTPYIPLIYGNHTYLMDAWGSFWHISFIKLNLNEWTFYTPSIQQ